MAALSPILRSVAGNRIAWWCPGCGESHVVPHGSGGADGPRWMWNGDAHLPVLTPSVLVTWSVPPPREPDDPPDRRCHCYIGCNGAQPGEIKFLDDCTHALAGQVVPVPPWPTS